ncbi:MAG: hypothetical protein ACREIC_25710, partial [Limisphaerales bacterium]
EEKRRDGAMSLVDFDKVSLCIVDSVLVSEITTRPMPASCISFTEMTSKKSFDNGAQPPSAAAVGGVSPPGSGETGRDAR